MSKTVEEILHDYREKVIDEIGVYHETISKDIEVLRAIDNIAIEAISQLLIEAKIEELNSLLKTTNYDDVPYFVGITAEVVEQRIRALGTRHEWQDNDTWSVFKCRKCGMSVFAPHPLPEYGCTNLQSTLKRKDT